MFFLYQLLALEIHISSLEIRLNIITYAEVLELVMDEATEAFLFLTRRDYLAQPFPDPMLVPFGILLLINECPTIANASISQDKGI